MKLILQIAAALLAAYVVGSWPWLDDTEMRRAAIGGLIGFASCIGFFGMGYLYDWTTNRTHGRIRSILLSRKTR